MLNSYGVLGPVLGWLHAIEAFKKSDLELPVNLKFVIEGMLITLGSLKKFLI